MNLPLFPCLSLTIRVCALQHRQIDIWHFKNISDLVLTVFSWENTLPLLCYNFTIPKKGKR